MKLTHLGLFEGIGGFSLAARWMGWETLAWCEWNEFGQKVLKYHFPEAEGFGDITKTDFTKHANRIDILTGNQRLQGSEDYRSSGRSGAEQNKQPTGLFRTDWQNFPTQSPVCERNDGLSTRLSGITFPKWRAESIKAMGNAVVVPVVYEIFKAIEKYEIQQKTAA